MTYESQEEHDHFEGAMEQSEKAYSEACCEKCGTGDPLVEFSCDKPDCPCHLKEILTKATLEANAEQKKIVDEYRKHKSWKDCNLECNIVKPIPTPESIEEEDKIIYNCGDFGCNKHSSESIGDWRERLAILTHNSQIFVKDYEGNLLNITILIKDFIENLLAQQAETIITHAENKHREIKEKVERELSNRIKIILTDPDNYLRGHLEELLTDKE